MKQLSSMMVGLACSGSSTPPMPTPPDKCTFLPIWAQEPTVAQVSTMRAFVDIGADIDVRGHQHHVPADEAAAARDRGRHYAKAAGGKLLAAVVAELGRHLVVVLGRGPGHHLVVVQPERQQHRLLQPLMRDPLAVDFFGHAQPPGVERGDNLLHRVADFRVGRARAQFGALVEGQLNRLLQLLHALSRLEFITT